MSGKGLNLITDGKLTDYVEAALREKERGETQLIYVVETWITTNPQKRFPVRNHGRIDHWKVAEPESYYLTLTYYLNDDELDPLPNTLFSLELGSELFSIGTRHGQTQRLNGTACVVKQIRFQKRSSV